MTDEQDALAPLARALGRILGGAGAVQDLTRLTGGANMESWSFDHDGNGYVLRRAPSGALMAGRSFGHDVEAAVVRAAHAHGVLAPEIVGELTAADGIGTGYVMRRIAGDVRPDRILANAAPTLLDDLVRELALIHAIPMSALPAGLPHPTTVGFVDELRARFESHGGDRPIMALALAWLNANLPTDVPPVLLHGDFRLGNLIADVRGLTGVLDWELAHLGDRHQDLAYGCINSWRFGQIDRPAFGLGSSDALFAAYERQTGLPVEPARFRFWLVYSTLWWGLTCLEMGEIWRSGRDRTLERAVIGRRTSETEVDLLLLLEADAPEAERGRVALPPPRTERRQGEPSHLELLEAITGWIEADVKPRSEGRERFLANVALNALGMLRRDADPVHDRALSDELLTGHATLATPGLLARLKQSALAKLSVDQPKYSALERARDLWGTR